jgi:hypothetical protein
MNYSLMQRMRGMGLGLLLLGLLLLAGCFKFKSPPPAEKPAAPEADELAAKEKEIDELFKDVDKEDQPRIYLEKGKQTKDDLVGRFALLNRARAAAANQGDMRRAFDAVDLLAKDWDVNALALKKEAVATLFQVLKDPDDEYELTKHSLDLVNQSIEADNYEVAKQLAALAENSFKKAAIKDPDEFKAVQSRVESAKKRALETEKEFEAVKESQETLKEKPDDAEANLVWGKFLCFIKGNWDKGLPHLAKSDDEDLKPLAKKELEKPSNTKDLVELGDSWWDLGDKEQGVARLQLKRRALFWYKKVENSVRGLTQEKVKKRISEVERVS